MPLGYDNPTALVVLVEEELVVIDLLTPGWPTIPSPYLAPLHSSAITCAYHIANVTLKLWERIILAGEQQNPHFSSVVSASPLGPIGGHIDHSVQGFWWVTSALSLNAAFCYRAGL